MARKSIKGYSEKNYYDNTKFSGVTATYDILNEGSFRHMVNLDISDTGKSVTPRKGYLTTEFVNNEGYPIALTKNTIYFQEPTTGEYIFLDFSSVDQTTEIYETVVFNPAFTWSCDLTSNDFVSHSIMNSGCIEAMSPHEVENVGTIPERIVFKKDVQEIYLTPYIRYWSEEKQEHIVLSELHKITKEKKYYIVNEQHEIIKENSDGYIRLLVQEEMLPGATTTATLANIQYNLKSTENNIILELDTNALLVNSSYSNILFKKAVRVYDSSSNYLLKMNVFKTSFSVADNKFITTPIINVNAQDLLNYLNVKKNELIHITPVNNFAEIIYDEYGVKQNVIKVDYLGKQFWINLIYNKSDDMLYLTPVHTEDPVGILSGDRNIASDKSIIPAPMYQIYEKDKAPIGHYNRIPMIYAEQNGKYLVETANTLNGLKLKPSFFIEDFSEDDKYEWAYTYDIRSTSSLNVRTYTSPVYNLETHESYTEKNLLNEVDDVLGTGFTSAIEDDAHLREQVSHLSWTKNKWLISSHMQNKYVVYVVPGEDSTIGTFKLNKKALDNIISYPSVNEYITLSRLFANHNTNCLTLSISLKELESKKTPTEVYKFFEDKNVRFFVVPLSDLEDYSYTPTKNYLYNYYNTVLYSNVMFLPDNLLTLQEFKTKYLDKVNHLNTYYFKVFDSISRFTIDKDLFLTSTWENEVNTTNGMIVRDYMGTYFPLTESTNYMCTVGNKDITDYTIVGMDEIDGFVNVEMPATFTFPIPRPSGTYTNRFVNFNTGITNRFDNSLFYTDLISKEVILDYNTNNEIIKRLNNNFFFDNGIDLTFYLLRRPTVIPEGMNYDIYERELLISSTTLYQSSTITLDNNEPTYIPERITEEPKAIMESKNTIVFRDTLGDHLVVWNNNQVFVSEPNTYYYFKYTGMFSYPAKVIKVIQYKDTLLVFTAQDLYSIFPYESTVQVQDGTDDEGNPKYVQSKVITYNTLPVLYNLMVDEKYVDAIQVFNQMVLFYSADGQMFMIKPTATIDSNTRFSIQYFNKSANDILANYDVYINERLKVYDIKKSITKDDVVIKVSVNINYIKIFYCVPNVITYILIYDVVNNYYYVYDTITYTHITNILLHEGYEMYCTLHKERLYITLPYRDVYNNDNNTDIACYNNFYKHNINTELDTGNLNLNNHIKKRFRNLHTTYKNINAHKLMYTVESFLDDVPVLTSVQDTIEVKDVEGKDTYAPVQVDNKVDLLAENTALFDFSAYNVNKIITHKSNIISSGKSFRLRLRFASKGRYKILGYGLVYKEYHV